MKLKRSILNLFCLCLFAVSFSSCKWVCGRHKPDYSIIKDSIRVTRREKVDTVHTPTVYVRVDCDSLEMSLHPDNFPLGGDIGKSEQGIMQIPLECPPSINKTVYVDTSSTYFWEDTHKIDSLSGEVDDLHVKTSKAARTIVTQNKKIDEDSKYKLWFFLLLSLVSVRILWKLFPVLKRISSK